MQSFATFYGFCKRQTANFGSRRLNARFFPALLALGVLICASIVGAQTTVGTGSIVGTVTDPSGALVSGAKLTITNVGTAAMIALNTNSAGSYNSGALTPGTYKVQISTKDSRPLVR